MAPSSSQRIEHRPFERAAAPTGVDDPGAMCHGVIDTSNGIVASPKAVCGEELASHQAHVPSHANVGLTVICGGADGAGDVSAMIIVVEWVSRTIGGVDAEHVIHVAVLIIIF